VTEPTAETTDPEARPSQRTRSRRRIALRILAAITALVVLAAIWGFVIEPRRLVVHEASLGLHGWPDAQNDLRVAVLTDLHVGSPHHGIETLRRIVARTNALDPDVVLLLGDLVIQGVVGGSFVAPEDITRELAALSSRLGTYAVLGNHDWWLDAARVAAALRAVGVVLLEDSAASVGGLWLAGVSDYWEGRHDVQAALRGVPEEAPVIVFTHNPDIFPDVPAHVELTVAGHTHGGQVNLPLIGRPIVPSDYGQRYAAGHVIENGRHLFVSTGTGTSILPVRFRVPPEIVLLRLRGRP
jgi:predicted MPP superfamily phosphohydrolase